MTKYCLFAVALVSVAFWTGCAKGLGSTPSVTVSTNPPNQSVVGANQTLQFVATVTGTSNTAVNWSLAGTACTGSGNPCGTILASGLYTAPATLTGSSLNVTVKATSQADSSGQGQMSIRVLPIKVFVTPGPTVSVGQGLTQQFTAVATPDNVAQTFTWTCMQGSVACANFVQDSTTSGLAVYTAAESPCSGCITVTATSTVNPSSPPVDSAKVSVVSSRIPASTYALRFSGYDNAGHPVEIAGSVTFRADGTIASGVEDVKINGVYHQYTTVSGLFAPSTAGDNSTNNAGILTLSASGAPTYIYSAVLDSAGNLRMIESDANGTGSGSMEKSTSGQFNTAAQRFVFGLTGVDSSGNRVGYAGVLPLDGNGNITGGLGDGNDGGSSVCAVPPCSLTGTYQIVGGVWTMQLLLGSQALSLDFFVGSGQTTANTKNPLTLHAISKGANDLGLSGRMVFQDPAITYDQTALNADSVSHLTGVNSTGTGTLVSLVAATGLSNGSISETFDANNAGTIVPAATTSSTCTYTTDANKTGRYVVTMLGTGSTCTSGLPFVLYASGANRGFLLDQSSTAVMTGAMDPQTGVGTFAPSELPGTYAAGTVSNATSGVIPLVANLLLTSPGNQKYNVQGTQYPGPVAVTGTYTLMVTGTGTIVLTAPAANYVIYTTDTSHFEMIDVDTSVTNAAVIFAQQ
ncbi:MAG: hypothetical protein LAO56_15145 [Acidobacteriia bacterium]|nr:hypothetical protein [Terriglobia bacterium]